MADISVERKSGGGTTWLWALLAVASVAGFMFWLYSESQEIETAAVVEGDTAAVAEPGLTGEAAELSAIATTPDAFAGRTLQVEGVPVAATVGPRAFWGDVPGQNPFLVVFGPEVQAEGVAAGQRYTIVGTVQPVDEAALNEWVTAGAIGQAQREEASFATHALLAQQATPAAPAGGQ
jgi:hypothetical protein